MEDSCCTESKQRFPEKVIMTGELKKSGEWVPLSLQCVKEKMWWIVHYVSQFVQCPPIPHRLKRLPVLTNDGSKLANEFVDHDGISGTDAAQHYRWHVPPQTGRRSPGSCCICQRIWASSENRVCSSPSCTQSWSWSSPICHSMHHVIGRSGHTFVPSFVECYWYAHVLILTLILDYAFFWRFWHFRLLFQRLYLSHFTLFFKLIILTLDYDLVLDYWYRKPSAHGSSTICELHHGIYAKAVVKIAIVMSKTRTSWGEASFRRLSPKESVNKSRNIKSF